MVDPLIALCTAGTAMLTCWFLFRPKHGYYWQWRRIMGNTERILIEDSLKHLYNCEYKKIPGTLPGISGILGITGDRAAKLVELLEAHRLVMWRDKGLQLTDEGRAYALRIIRVHRLWERYLADKTGFPEMEWHSEAEYKEHTMSIQEANILAARMGNPRFDPHGDPIPTASGELPPPKGILLTALPQGKFAEIIHIEDEPAAIYAQLIAQGLHLGMQIQMLNVSAERLYIAAPKDEIILAPVFAANVTVQPLPEKYSADRSSSTLSDLSIGEKGIVTGISKACRGLQRRRLMDLGILPGTTISVEMRSASGDPTAFIIKGAMIALRKKQSSLIFIKNNGND